MPQNNRSVGLVPLVAVAVLALLLEPRFATTTNADPSDAGGSATNDAAPAGRTTAPQPKQSLTQILKGTFQAFSDDRTLAVAAGRPSTVS